MLDEAQKTWLIDFDKCGILKGDKWKQQNLQRLLRSFNKERAKQHSTNQPFNWCEAQWPIMLQGYAEKAQR
jgi:predicted Ser/Thr protein kinase